MAHQGRPNHPGSILPFHSGPPPKPLPFCLGQSPAEAENNSKLKRPPGPSGHHLNDSERDKSASNPSLPVSKTKNFLQPGNIFSQSTLQSQYRMFSVRALWARLLCHSGDPQEAEGLRRWVNGQRRWKDISQPSTELSAKLLCHHIIPNPWPGRTHRGGGQ